MAKFRRSPKFGRNHSRLGSLDGVQFTHPLAEITQRTRWGPEKVQVTLKPFIGSRTNHNKSSLPTLGSFRYPQRVQNGPFGLKQTLTGKKALYSKKITLHGYATEWTEAHNVPRWSADKTQSIQMLFFSKGQTVDCDGLNINNPA